MTPSDRLSALLLNNSKVSLSSVRCLECSQQGIVFPGTAIQDAINKKCRSALHATSLATFYILLDAGESALFGQSACILLQIETDRFGKISKVGILQRML